nr:DNA internalization-related competence protein ComEC/Rec2 [Vibrio gangliei]
MPSLILLLPIVVLFLVLFSTKNAYCLQGVCLGCLLIIIHGNHYRHVTEKLFSHGSLITVQAKIVALNQTTLHGAQTILSIQRINGDVLPFYAQPQVKAYYASPNQPPLKLGELWQLQLEVKPAIGRLNDAGFDNERYYVSNQWHGKAVIESENANNTLLKSSSSWRLSLHNDIKLATASLPSQSFILALAFGDRSLITDKQWQQLRDSGLAHLMAISGLHIALAMGIGWQLGRIIKTIGAIGYPAGYYAVGQLMRMLPMLMSFGLAVMYSYLAGFSLPTQRALVMGTLWLLTLLFRIHWSIWQILLFSLVLVLAWQPFSILQASFWLSFSAIMVIYLSLWFCMKPEETSSQHRFKLRLIRILTVQMGLFIGLAFISASVFGGLSWVSPLVNLVAIPWVSVIVVPLIFLMLALSSLFIERSVSDHSDDSPLLSDTEFVHDLLATGWKIVDISLQPITKLLDWAEGAWWPLSNQSVWLCLILVMSVLLWRFRCFVTLFVVLLLAGVLHFGMFQAVHSPRWQVQVVDVGQGLAILIRKDGRSVLYDTGIGWQGGSMVRSIVTPLLNQSGEWQLDGLIISHTDFDHAGGRKDAEHSLNPKWKRSSELISGYQPCVKGQSWQWQGLQFEALWPPKQVTRAYNPHSCVVRISDSTFSLLLTGDIDAISEILLTREAGIKPVDVMTVPHHGSSTSSFPTLLEVFQPKVAVASLALNNQWGLPSQMVKQRYQQAGIPWLDTGTGGQITLSIYSNDWSIEQKRRDQYQPWYRQIVRNGLE